MKIVNFEDESFLEELDAETYKKKYIKRNKKLNEKLTDKEKIDLLENMDVGR